MTYSVAVSGASGYAGGEILRLLADHPDFEVRTVTAHANAGQPLVAVQPHLRTFPHPTLRETPPAMTWCSSRCRMGDPGPSPPSSIQRPSSSTAAPTTGSSGPTTGPR